jgi:hypothetical protein
MKTEVESSTFVVELPLEEKLIRLERENRAAFLTIERLSKELSEKSQKLKHLEDLLSKNTPVLVPSATPAIKTKVTSEESIAETQLERLRQISEQRSLTLEETRMYDLLVKNKRLSQDESTVNLQKGGYRDVSDIELLKAVRVPSESDKT